MKHRTISPFVWVCFLWLAICVSLRVTALIPCPTVSCISRGSIKYHGRTELHMGLRDFISKKVRRKDEDPNRKSQKAVEAGEEKISGSKSRVTPAAAAAAAAASEKQDTKQRRVRMGESPDGDVNVETLGPETVQQRIQRIKRGQMSADEKEAFLRSALSTGNTPESRLPMTRSSSSRDLASQKPSPFPTDSILRNMASGGKPLSQEVPVSESQKKKQKYLDMVTDPNRFDKYKSSSKRSGSGSPPIRQEIPDVPEQKIEKVPSPVSSDAKAEQPSVPMDLGARLGVHAMEAEKRSAELRKQQEEKERQLEEQRRERERRLIEAQKQRQEEMNKREAEVIERRKRQEQEMAKSREEKMKQEKARQAQLLKAQEDYWTKKLAETKRTAEEKKMDEEKKKQQKTQTRDAAPTEQEIAAESDIDDNDAADDAPWAKSDGEDQAPQSPRRYSDNNLINRAATEVFGNQKLNDVPHPRNKMKYEEEKRSQRQRQDDEYLQRLKSLNSPLPRKSERPKPTHMKRQAFEPQRPVNARSRSPAQSLGDLTKTIKNPIPSMPKSQSTSSDLETRSGMASNDEDTIAGRSSSFFSRFSGPKSQETEESSPSPAFVPQRTPPAAPPKPKPAPAREEKKGPIRMQLPLGDDEDDEPLVTEGMTIGEVMKRRNEGAGNQEERSKKWGIDMSRFQN